MIKTILKIDGMMCGINKTSVWIFNVSKRRFL